MAVHHEEQEETHLRLTAAKLILPVELVAHAEAIAAGLQIIGHGPHRFDPKPLQDQRHKRQAISSIDVGVIG